MFELKDRDANGRICKWVVNDHEITTPTIMPVVNPSKMVVSIEDLKKLGAKIIITNSFIIRNSRFKEECVQKGLHEFLKWKGPIYTDSGTFQMFSQGIKDISQEEIIEFQNQIKSDIVTPVDLFTLPDDTKKQAIEKTKETSKRVFAAKQLTKNLVGPIQGGLFLDLRKKACKEIAAADPELFAIGGIVPLMEQYRYKELFEIILTCKENLPAGKPVHAFGAGHPMIFAPLVALGVDLFDSAMYALAAASDRYLTVNGTHQLADLTEFPCNCPECVKTTPEEVRQLPKQDREIILAKHNLYVTFGEIRTIRQAIKENNLWELVQTRLRAHPNLLEAFETVKKHKKYLMKQDLISKKSALFYSGKETEFRPEVLRAKEMIKGMSGQTFLKKPFGKVPTGLKGVYPFGQSIVPGFKEKSAKVDPKDIVRQTIEYQYGFKFKENFSVELSRQTGRIRRVWRGKQLLGTIRANDGFFIPTLEGAKYMDMKKVIVDDEEIAKHVKAGKSLFVRFIDRCDDIIPGEEVAIIYNKEIIATGTAILNKKEISEFQRGVAIKIR
ncbi:MAG: tRNA guanosine(15) transglycosylase TgtA [Candidatus Aenigmarchaeota archaeon]|nr:tRNA guanosine(15) transglycosylase TgtA [Candidatus Aenigmarchaeota archaeon]